MILTGKRENEKPAKAGFFWPRKLIIDDKYYFLLTILRCVVGLAGGGGAEGVIGREKGGSGLTWIAVNL
jgi:hypothetical protein